MMLNTDRYSLLAALELRRNSTYVAIVTTPLDLKKWLLTVRIYEVNREGFRHHTDL